MPSLGSYAFTTLEGRVPDFVPDLDLVTRPGVSGHGVIYDADRAGAFTLVTGVAVASGADALMTAYKALEWSTQQLSHDADGLRSVLVLGVQSVPSTLVDGTTWVRTTWRLLEV